MDQWREPNSSSESVQDEQNMLWFWHCFHSLIYGVFNYFIHLSSVKNVQWSPLIGFYRLCCCCVLCYFHSQANSRNTQPFFTGLVRFSCAAFCLSWHIWLRFCASFAHFILKPIKQSFSHTQAPIYEIHLSQSDGGSIGISHSVCADSNRWQTHCLSCIIFRRGDVIQLSIIFR